MLKITTPAHAICINAKQLRVQPLFERTKKEKRVQTLFFLPLHPYKQWGVNISKITLKVLLFSPKKAIVQFLFPVFNQSTTPDNSLNFSFHIH